MVTLENMLHRFPRPRTQRRKSVGSVVPTETDTAPNRAGTEIARATEIVVATVIVTDMSETEIVTVGVSVTDMTEREKGQSRRNRTLRNPQKR